MSLPIAYGVIGAGGFGREVMPICRNILRDDISSGNAELFFVTESEIKATKINGVSVISFDEFQLKTNRKQFNIAIGNSAARERIAEMCIKSGAHPFSIISESAVVMDENTIGSGAILSPFVTITSNATIGSFFHANIYSYVAHDCVIGNYVTFAPSVKCNGNVIIEDHAYVGTGAIIKQGNPEHPIVIGKGAVVGMGSVVTKTVLPFTTVIGNPARLLIK